MLLPPPTRSQTEVHVDGPSPRIVEGGLGRRGRVELATLALVALTRSVSAAATAAVAFAILMIAAMVMTLSLTLTAIVRGMR
jgi:hypothetical protein